MAARRRKEASPSPASPRRAAGGGWTPPTDVYEIEVTLRETPPPVWRRILVQGDMTLGRLHAVLQIAMGWQGSHLHMFRIGGKTYGDLENEMDDGESITGGDENEITVAMAFKAGKSRMVYEYDFGDCWEHDLKVVKVHPPEAAPDSGPACVAGARACPPEDVGGTPGYGHFLEVMADPEHEEYEDLSGWIGGSFDPEKFDLNAVNRDLKRLR